MNEQRLRKLANIQLDEAKAVGPQAAFDLEDFIEFSTSTSERKRVFLRILKSLSPAEQKAIVKFTSAISNEVGPKPEHRRRTNVARSL